MAGGWELLKSVTTSGNTGSGETITTGTISAAKFLKLAFYGVRSSNQRIALRFNGDGADTNKYAVTHTYGWQPTGNTSNGTNESLTSQDEIVCMGYAANDSQTTIVHIFNPSQGEKLCWVQSVDDEVGNPSSYQGVGKWASNDQITSIQVVNKGSGNIGSGATLTVWGSDDATLATSDASKDSITNVPAGTRYEETDTRKIFRRKIGVATTHNGFDLTGTSNDGGDCWTNEPIRGQKILAGNNLIGKTITTATFRVKSHNANLEGDLTLGVWNSSGVLQHTFWRGRGKDHITTSESNITGNAEKVTWWTGNNEARNIGNNGGRLGLGVKISTGHYLIGKTINKFTVRLKIDTGSPTGNMTAHIRRNGSSDIDSTTTLDASTVTSSNADYSFSFPDTVIANGDIITIEYASGSSANINLRTCESIGTSPYDTVSNETGMKATSTPSTYSNWVTEASGGETGSLCYHATQVGSGGHTIAEGDIIGFASNASTSHRLSVRSYKYSNAGVSIANEEEGEYDGGWTPADGGIRDLQYSVVYLEDLWVEKGTA